MENNSRKAFSWSASFVIHGVGALLIIVASFHLATPEGSVTDKTEFEAVGVTPLPPQAQPPAGENQQAVQAPPTDSEAEAKPSEKQEQPQDTEAEAPAAEAPPPSDSGAPPVPAVADESAPAQKMAEADTENANADPAQEPQVQAASTPSAEVPATPTVANAQAGAATPVESPVPGMDAGTTAATPSESPAPGSPGATIGTAKDGTPVIDERKLSEAFGNHKPSYPWTARLRRQQGTVVLKAFVNNDGFVEKVSIETPSGFALLDEEAQRAYAHWKYLPGVSGWVLKPFRFSLKN